MKPIKVGTQVARVKPRGKKKGLRYDMIFFFPPCSVTNWPPLAMSIADRSSIANQATDCIQARSMCVVPRLKTQGLDSRNQKDKTLLGQGG